MGRPRYFLFRMNTNQPVPPATADLLLVDDDAQIMQVLTKVCERWGYTFQTASNGKRALQLMARTRFRAILTDILMPDMDGIELLIHYRKSHPAVPVVAMSGGGNLGPPQQMLKMARGLGCTHILPKPFDLESLRVLLTSILSHPSPQDVGEKQPENGQGGERQKV